YGNPELVRFFKDRFEKDDSYLAQAEALRSIGKCGDRSQLPFLEEKEKMSSPRNVIKNAAEFAAQTIKRKQPEARF
ncbi:MAG: hypothetical protein OEZ52_08160, partial [Candidatus Aminicenantes bacterium]|nr:hypothetical protein [Candidatus Aminicenantes bacterium]